MIGVDKKLDSDAFLTTNETSVQTIPLDDEGIIYTLFCSKCVKWIPPSDHPHTKRWCSVFQKCKTANLAKNHMVMIIFRKKNQATKGRTMATPQKLKTKAVFSVVLHDGHQAASIHPMAVSEPIVIDNGVTQDKAGTAL